MKVKALNVMYCNVMYCNVMLDIIIIFFFFFNLLVVLDHKLAIINAMDIWLKTMVTNHVGAAKNTDVNRELTNCK